MTNRLKRKVNKYYSGDTSISVSIPKMLAGSALAGFGLSFGRDVYKTTKRNFISICFIVLVFAIGGLLYSSCIWLIRNYKTSMVGIFKRLGAIIVFIPTYFITYNILWVVCIFFYGFFGTIISEPFFLSEYSFAFYKLLFLLIKFAFQPMSIDINEIFSLKNNVDPFLLDTNLFAFIGVNFVVLLGVLSGIKHKNKRRLAWDIEKHNERFLEENEIEELDEINFRDANGNRFKIKNIFPGEIEFMAVGKRNKRAYIKVDDFGKFLSWSGIVSL